MQELKEQIDLFYELIERNESEQKYQEFLEKYTKFIPRQFVQHHGIHLKLALSKTSLGGELNCDFLYLSKTSKDWNCVFIEIEKPYSKYFKDGADEFHSDFQQGLNQINKWRSWLSQNGNRDGFLNSINYIMGQGWLGNPCHFKYILVTGRSAEFSQNSQRRSLISACERDDFKILTYDSLAEGIDQKPELYIGAKKNNHIKIISEKFNDESLFSWIPPEMLRITQLLKDDIINNRHEWFHSSLTEGYEWVLDEMLPKIKVTNPGR